ncbi:MAG: proton-conducting transporter membrane subunit [Syntrophotaleaceae bacterium]
MSPELFLVGLAIIMAGGIGALLAGRVSRAASRWAAGCTLIGSFLGLTEALHVLTSGSTLHLSIPGPLPEGDMALALDPLSACFLLPVFLLAALCAVFGTSYLAEEEESRNLGPHWFFYCGLVVSMALVLTAANGLLFLAVWELMSLASFFLVAYENRRTEVVRAAWIYLIACHLGSAFLFALFLLAGNFCGSLQFADFVRLGGVSPGFALLLFLLCLVGFGTKAGLFPLHVWLPDAHPAAPSHVSALMSGAMVKTGIYGILRISTLLPLPPAWLGLSVAFLGILGALYGILLAAVQSDIKRCLAYSTVENVGIIFVGIGAGMYGLARHQEGIAMLGFAGALLHVWNHALFKGLMFLGAGSLSHGAGTRDMNRMGGLLRRMPVTGGLLVGGSLAIAALPPLNGLVGEWLIYLGLLRTGLAGDGFAGLLPLVLAVLLAVTGALAVVVFTRLAGVALLGEPRSDRAAAAHEAPTAMSLPMKVLLLGCLAVGLAPQAAVRLLTAPLVALTGAGVGELAAHLRVVANLGLAALVILLGLALVFGLLLWLCRMRPAGRSGTWGCGFSFPSARMAYTAGSYAELTQNHLVPAPLRSKPVSTAPEGLFPAAGRLVFDSLDPILDRMFQPFFRRFADRIVRLRWLQQGKLPIYLLYIFAACALLIAWSVLEGRGWRLG